MSNKYHPMKPTRVAIGTAIYEAICEKCPFYNENISCEEPCLVNDCNKAMADTFCDRCVLLGGSKHASLFGCIDDRAGSSVIPCTAEKNCGCYVDPMDGLELRY